MKTVVILSTDNLGMTVADMLNPREMKLVGMGDTRQETWNVFSDLEKGELETDYNQSIRRLKSILQEIGILSEAGSKDIIRIVRYLIEEDLDIRDITVRELCSRMGQNSKSVEQRIRRAASVGMANLAYRGMDDYADPVFNEYGARLYSLEQIKREMSYIRGKSDGHGNVRVRKFLSGLLVCCKDI